MTLHDSAEASVLARLAVRVEKSTTARDAVLYALYVLRRMPLVLGSDELPPLYSSHAPHGNFARLHPRGPH